MYLFVSKEPLERPVWIVLQRPTPLEAGSRFIPFPDSQLGVFINSVFQTLLFLRGKPKEANLKKEIISLDIQCFPLFDPFDVWQWTERELKGVNCYNLESSARESGRCKLSTNYQNFLQRNMQKASKD